MVPAAKHGVFPSPREVLRPGAQALLIHQIIEEQARRTPEAPAVVDGDLWVTYRELDTMASHVARHLECSGVEPDTLVGVLMKRSVRLIASILGILKAGAAYVPLDPAYPPERIKYMVADARVHAMVTERELHDSLTGFSGTTIYADSVTETADPIEEPSCHHRVTPSHLAYVIYTSGSTGRPKGSAIEHHSAVTLLRWAADVFSDAALAGVLASTSICFDLSVFEMFVPLSRGGKIILAQNALQLPWLPAKEQVTLINTVPSAMTELLRIQGVPASVRIVNLAGEPLQRKLVQQIYQHPNIEKVYNLYGPSEDTTYSTFALIEKADLRPPSIGHPIRHTQVYLLDAELQSVSDGTAGELCISGDGLARGYLGRPDLTAEKFIPDPFGVGRRVYRTGDLARLRNDGELEFLGRRDHQVKLRGHRIELLEIESVLAEHPDVDLATVTTREDTPGDQRLVAYVVGRASALLHAGELRDYLSARLPAFMIPNHIVELETLPRTPNGKVDRAALPAPGDLLAFREPSAPTRTPTQELLAGIWREVLQLSSVGIRDNFFLLGGHSLLGAQVLSRIRETFGVEFSLARIFAAPTVESLAECIDQDRIQGDQTSRKVVAGPRPIHVPCSFAQRALWLFDQLSDSSPCYNVPLAFKVSGPLNVPALEESVNAIVQRHESLRTRFNIVSGEPVQTIGELLKLKVSRLDLSCLPEAKRPQGVNDVLGREGRQRFHLERDTLLRVLVIKTGENEHVLLLVVHHIVWDDWSARIFFGELNAIYRAIITGDVAAPLPAALQYADFALWEREWLCQATLERQLEYWRKRLSGISDRSALPLDRPRPKMESFRGGTRSLVIPASDAEQARSLAQHEGTTLAMFLFAAFYGLLHRYSGEEDLAAGWAVADRGRIEVENTIGLFVNTVVIRIDLAQHVSCRELLRRVRQACLEAYTHQDVAFDTLVQQLHSRRDPSQSPLIQSRFVHQNVQGLRPDLSGARVEPLEFHNGTAKMDLTFETWEEPAGIRCRLEYNADLFNGDTIERLGAHFGNVVKAMVTDPESLVRDVMLLSEAEQRQFIHERNLTAVEDPTHLSLIHAFEEQARKAPDAIALSYERQEMRYAELNERANQLAHYLIKQGVGPEQLVGICMERSVDMVVALLGVLKTGGAYVPLDPGYPQERLRYMVEASQTRFLLTREGLSASLPATESKLICLDREWSNMAKESSENPEPRSTRQNLAYVIFTSGSTGVPKGVMVTHGNVLRLMAATQQWFCFTSNDVWTLFHSYAFDFSVWELWGALLYGGRLVLVPYWVSRSPEEFCALLDREHVSVLNQTPSAFRQLMEVESGKERKLESLRLVIFGGEALDVSGMANWWQRYGQDCPRMINMYGITETTVHVTYKHLAEVDTHAAGLGSVIGVPIPDLQVYVLDAQGHLAPAGISGEMYVGGAGLARGYLNRPELTAARFVPDGFSGKEGALLYRTGDLAKWRPTGELEYLGRADHQVKVRGYRIELGEIESVLCQHAAVEAAVVMAHEDFSSGKKLVAYVEVRHESAGTEGDVDLQVQLRTFVRERLPEYMVPASFVVMQNLPLNSNGKVDRQALPAPDLQRSKALSSTPPRTPTEKGLTAIWKEVLGPEPGIYDDFFDLGGHSLSAAQIISRTEIAFRVSVSIRQLFEARTIARFAEVVEEALIGDIAAMTEEQAQELLGSDAQAG
jgi:amino acid adenylation domain-containing protein